MKQTIVAIMALACLAAPAQAAEKIKIGLVATLSGPIGVLGKHMKAGTELALEQLGGKLGGVPAELIVVDDQADPSTGKQVVDKLLKRDKVDIITGVAASNVMMAVYQPIIESRTPLIGTNAGPAPMAGNMCSPYFFSTSFQNDQAPAAAGRAMQQAGLKRVYVLTPNYRAGKDAIIGFKSEYKGEIVGETYTSMEQTDYSVELAKVRTAAPDGIFVFYPGGYGIQFLKQYSQAGMHLPLYTYGAMDQATLPALGDAAMGVKGVAIWSIDLPNEANKAFVQRFRSAYGYLPADFAAQAYDAVMLIDSAVRKVGGKVADRAQLIAALKQADFQSVRGSFRFNSNHFPIQNFLLREGVKDADGNYVTAAKGVVIGDATDPYAAQCKMN